MASNDDFDGLAIRAEGISKKFLLGRRSNSLKDRLTGISERNREEFWAFEDISVDIPQGSMLGVIGRNGSGKSTFLRTLSGIYRPTHGEVKVRGRITALLELGAGFHGELTGRENVYMNGAVVGLEREYMEDVMDEIIAMADIGSFIDAPIEIYSSGMRARLGFAVSVQMQPEILLADEITAVGDITFREHGVKRMNELREGGATIVQVSHNLTMLKENCDQVLWLHHGRTRRIGDPEEVIAEYKAQSAIDSSGRMIGGAAPSPLQPGAVPAPKEARLRKQEAVAESLATDELHASWFKTVSFTGPSDAGTLFSGEPALLSIVVSPEDEISEPSIEVRVLAARGKPTGLGYNSGPLDSDSLGARIEAAIDPLGLVAGHFHLRIDLLSAGEVVATSHERIQVRPPHADEKSFARMPAKWGIASGSQSVL